MFGTMDYAEAYMNWRTRGAVGYAETLRQNRQEGMHERVGAMYTEAFYENKGAVDVVVDVATAVAVIVGTILSGLGIPAGPPVIAGAIAANAAWKAYNGAYEGGILGFIAGAANAINIVTGPVNLNFGYSYEGGFSGGIGYGSKGGWNVGLNYSDQGGFGASFGVGNDDFMVGVGIQEGGGWSLQGGQTTGLRASYAYDGNGGHQYGLSVHGEEDGYRASAGINYSTTNGFGGYFSAGMDTNSGNVMGTVGISEHGGIYGDTEMTVDTGRWDNWSDPIDATTPRGGLPPNGQEKAMWDILFGAARRGWEGLEDGVRWLGEGTTDILGLGEGGFWEKAGNWLEGEGFASNKAVEALQDREQTVAAIRKALNGEELTAEERMRVNQALHKNQEKTIVSLGYETQAELEQDFKENIYYETSAEDTDAYLDLLESEGIDTTELRDWTNERRVAQQQHRLYQDAVNRTREMAEQQTTAGELIEIRDEDGKVIGFAQTEINGWKQELFLLDGSTQILSESGLASAGMLDPVEATIDIVTGGQATVVRKAGGVIVRMIARQVGSEAVEQIGKQIYRGAMKEAAMSVVDQTRRSARQMVEAQQAARDMTRLTKGEIGEAAAERTLTRAGYEQMPSKLDGNRGIDGVFVKRDGQGNVQDIILTESKYSSTGRAYLNQTRTMGQQFSGRWIEENIRKMLRSTNPEVRRTARFLNANSELIRRKVNVYTDGVNRWNKLLPPD